MKYRLLLLLTAFFWGCAFVAQRVGMDFIGPFGFNGVRFWVGTLAVLPLVWWTRRTSTEVFAPHPSWLTLPIACAILGFFLFMGSALQQWGLLYTTAGKAGFITSLYIVVVPILGLFLKTPLRLSHVVGCIVATIGVYLLAFHGVDQPINVGDMLELVGVVFWSLHILCINRFVPYFSGVELAAGQFFACGIYNFIAMVPFGESLTVMGIIAAAIPILYCGIFSSGIAYTLQIIGQKYVPPTEASLLCSFEMIFSVLAGMVLLGETMSLREVLGCVLMTIGIFAAQVPSRIVLSLGKEET